MRTKPSWKVCLPMLKTVLEYRTKHAAAEADEFDKQYFKLSRKYGWFYGAVAHLIGNAAMTGKSKRLV